MEDYPRNLTEFEARLGSEEACREYVFRLRWPQGFVTMVKSLRSRKRMNHNI